MFKKNLTLFLLVSSFFGIIVSSTRVVTFASTSTIQSNLLDPYAIWLNKNNQETNVSTDPKTNTSYSNAPYRVTMENNGTVDSYAYLLSVGAFDANSTPNRYIFGTNALGLNATYNLTHNALLTPFQSLSNATYESVFVLNQDLYFSEVTDMVFNYLSGTASDVHRLTPIYSIDQGVTWEKSIMDVNITTGSSSGTSTFSTLSNNGFEGAYLRVGFLLENLENNSSSDINIINPKMTITFSTISDVDAATLFATEIEDYSPCATVENGMTQLTLEKQNEFIDLYNELSAQGKIELQSITMGTGFTAANRYQYLVNFDLI
jgi:hypothetical protein